MNQPVNKTCAKCDQAFPIEKFARVGPKQYGSRDKYCSRCRHILRKASLDARPEYKAELAQRRQASYKMKQMLLKYDIPYYLYRTMIDNRHGKCDICSREVYDPDSERCGLYVDHDHNSGRVRGMLCHSCNAGIGFFKDNVDLLLKAVDYLRQTHDARAIQEIVE